MILIGQFLHRISFSSDLIFVLHTCPHCCFARCASVTEFPCVLFTNANEGEGRIVGAEAESHITE